MEAEAFLTGLGCAIREARNAKALSQEELQLATGIHRNYIGGIERGERSPTVSLVLVLGSALDLEPARLFSRASELADRS
jgi:transcriptional regulator with XRE-family HTH domain